MMDAVALERFLQRAAMARAVNSGGGGLWSKAATVVGEREGSELTIDFFDHTK